MRFTPRGEYCVFKTSDVEYREYNGQRVKILEMLDFAGEVFDVQAEDGRTFAAMHYELGER